MDQTSLSHIYQFQIDALNSKSRADQIRDILKQSLEHATGEQKVEADTENRILKILSSEPLDIAPIKLALQSHGFHPVHVIDPTSELKITKICIDGMTCHSCEVIIERKWKILPGVSHVEVQATSGRAKITHTGSAPSIAQLQTALGAGKYSVSINGTGQKTKPSFLELIGLFALVLLIVNLLSRFGLLKTNFFVGSGMNFGAIFIIGLVAASSSCIAITGGLLVSAAAKFNERYGSVGQMARMRPVLLFVAGRIVGYTILGGLLGVVGKALSPSPLVTAIITIVAAMYMLVMGLDMLQIAPAWLKHITPKIPKLLSHRVMDVESKEHPLAPLGLGAATFFLPCGFTQALQLYALTTGSFTTAALLMMAFAFGTAPALLALGWTASSLKGKAGRFFFKFSGALVVVLGLWNIQNGLTIAGYPISFPSFSFAAPSSVASGTGGSATMDGNTQVIRMAVNGGYQPSQFTIKAGLPTRWIVDGINAGGCTSVLVSRQLGIQKLLAAGDNTIEFTAPTQPGTYQFSCSMGMYRGQINVVANI